MVNGKLLVYMTRNGFLYRCYRMTADHHVNLYEAVAPLGYAKLVKAGVLKAIKSVASTPQVKYDLEEPCIMFAGDYTCLERGPIASLLRSGSKNNKTMCVITGKCITTLYN